MAIWIIVPDCYGVSLVWSFLWGMYGYALAADHKFNVPEEKRIFRHKQVINACVLNCLLFVYYAITYPEITSVRAMPKELQLETCLSS